MLTYLRHNLIGARVLSKSTVHIDRAVTFTRVNGTVSINTNERLQNVSTQLPRFLINKSYKIE